MKVMVEGNVVIRLEMFVCVCVFKILMPLIFGH